MRDRDYKALLRCAVALESIATTLQAIAPDSGPEPLVEAPVEAPVACEHPEDARIDFSGQGAEEWTCRACGFAFKG